MEPWLGGECELFEVVRDRRSRAVVFLALHDTRPGPAHGGIRCHAYASEREAAADVVALATAMTWKCALADVPAGGGKVVIVDHAGLDRAAAYRLVGELVERLQGRFFTGPDVGTRDADLAQVAMHTRFVARDDGDGPGDLAAATATGVASALAALAERLGRPLSGLVVAVQGLGAVGAALCRQLAAAGARLVVADVMPSRAAAVAAACGAVVVEPAAIVGTRCDVFAPCALGGVLDVATCERLPARGVCGAANNVFADGQAPHVLHRRGVLVVPDFVANAGALIAGATWHLQHRRVDEARLRRIGATAAELLDRAGRQAMPPSLLALAMARERVEHGR